MKLQKLTELTPEEVRLGDALLLATQHAGDLADRYGLDRARFGEALVQMLLVTLRSTHPGAERRERAMEAINQSLDAGERIATRPQPTHGATHVEQ